MDTLIQTLKTTIRRFDRGILLALLVGAIAAWPFWSRPGLPAGNDAELHIVRIAELGYSLRAGVLYPRWAPNFYHGYGYPIFNYYAPLTYHLGNWLTLVHPEHALYGAKALFIIAHLLGATGAYLLGREFGDQGGGFLGSVAFTFSPYIFAINPHVRGDLAEVVALALVPWALWSWERLWHGGGRRVFVAAVFSAGSVLLSHNLTGLTIMVLLVLLSAWHWFVSRRSSRVGWAFLAGLLVVALTAYFWLPFVAERSFIKLDVAGDGHYDFRNHFVSLSELMAFLAPLDWGSTAVQVPMSAGPLVVALAIASSAATLIEGTRETKHRLLFYLFCSAGCFFLITEFSRPVWEIIPGFAYYQFPWRFLGPLAALLVPLVAASGRKELWHEPATQAYAPLIVGTTLVLILAAFPGLYPLPWDDSERLHNITPSKMQTFELEGRWRGTTSTNDFVPSTVDMIPGPQDSVLDSYRAQAENNGIIDRVNRYTLPEGAEVTILEDRPGRLSFHVSTPEKFPLRFYLFDFPGWTAYVNDVETPIELALPEGFITVPVQKGMHNVRLEFRDTTSRRVGWGITLIGGIVFLIAFIRFPGERREETPASTRSSGIWRWGVAGLSLIILFKVSLADHVGWWHYQSPPGEAWAASHQQYADFGGEIALLGFDLSKQRVSPGETLEVTLYWLAQQPLTQTYQSFVHLVRPEGEVWSQSDHLNPAGFPTNLWPIDRYVWDRHRLSLPLDMPAGEYTVSVGFFTLRDGARLPVLEADAGKRTDNIILQESVTVVGGK